MTIQKSILNGALAALSAAGLAACGGDSSGSQDVGTKGGTASRALAARTVDGYLAGATVYVDQNENGVLDAFEPRAVTDSDGYFSYNHKTSVDYCAASAQPIHARHCLKASIAADAEVLIRVTGGYDTVTRLPFEGVMSLRSRELDSNDLRLVTPMTSMVAQGGSTQQKLDALIRAGVLQGSLDQDHIGELLDGQALRAQLTTSIVRILEQAADTAAGPVFADVPEDGWYMGYIAMAAKLVDDPRDFDEVFSSGDVSLDMVRRIAHSQLYPGQSMPEGFRLPNEAAAQPLLLAMTELVTLNGELVTRLEQGQSSQQDMTAALRVQAVAAERLLQNGPQGLADVIGWVDNQLAQGNGLGADLTELGAPDVDPSALTKPEFDFDPLSNSISASAKIPAEAAQLFAALVNTSFGVRVNEGDEQGAALIFIGGGASGARSGEIDVCVRYRDSDGDFDTGSSRDPDGALLVGGTWSLLDDHTLLLNLDLANGMRSLLLKSVGGSLSDRAYRFDFGGEFLSWSGTAPAGFAPGNVPTSDAACKTTLIERFGSMM
jgi:hypothetical protein